MKFRDHLKDNSQAAHVVTLPPSAFASTFSRRPTADVAVGIRCISGRDVLTAKLEATRAVTSYLGEGWRQGDGGANEVWNDVMIRVLVHRGTCDPNDRTIPFDLFGLDDENVKEALTAEATKRLWDEVEAFALSVSPAWPAASEAELERLKAALTEERLIELPASKAARIRRLVTFLLSELE